MSGGSYRGCYWHVIEFAEALEKGETLEGRKTEAENNHDRLGFAAHLRKVAAAMKAIEWVDSYDSSPPEDTIAIHAVTGV